MNPLEKALKEIDDELDREKEEIKTAAAATVSKIQELIADVDFRMGPLPEFNRRDLYRTRCELLQMKGMAEAALEKIFREMEEYREKTHAEVTEKYCRVWGSKPFNRPTASMAN